MDESNINGRQPSTEWGSVLSKVVDQLPTVDSDSEVSHVPINWLLVLLWGVVHGISCCKLPAA